MLILFHISFTFIQTSFFITTKFTSFKSSNLMFCLRCAYCVVFSMLTYDLMLENFRFFLYSLSFFNSMILIKWFEIRSIQNRIRFWINILFQQWIYAMFMILLFLKTFTKISQLICESSKKLIFSRYSTFHSSSTKLNHVQIWKIITSNKSHYIYVHENWILMFEFMRKRFVFHDQNIWFNLHTFFRKKQ